jgi:hypothetical protein
VLLTFSPLSAAAQSGPSLNELAIDWARGQYGSPITCQVGDEAVRALRRVILSPQRGDDGRPVLSLHFIDMRAEDATRCFDVVGIDQPNLLGRIYLRLEGRPHRDTAMRDFNSRIRRERGFEFEILSGSLKIQPVTSPRTEARTVDFRGGRVRLHAVAPATDAARALAEFDSPRKALLEVESKSGERLSLALFLASER